MSDSHTALTALSPLDGRYASKAAPLAAHFSEFGLVRARVRVEIAWLLALANEPGIPEVAPFSRETRDALFAACDAFSVDDAARVVTKKPVGPSEEEVGRNPRSRSSKMRVIEKT